MILVYQQFTRCLNYYIWYSAGLFIYNERYILKF